MARGTSVSCPPWGRGMASGETGTAAGGEGGEGGGGGGGSWGVMFCCKEIFISLTEDISDNLPEISGVANAVMAMNARGRAYMHFANAHLLDFFFHIMVILFLSLL
ncbi:MAG: hypothetical protein BWX93_00436 [Bacteroidetes bacterium ADurb.Bin139]|nr:MAG: hypothetical protein BWX93_00436 [Bacteroidetes bacterium ADurb.Bin139]